MQPIEETAHSVVPPGSSPGMPVEETRTVLLVDDDADILEKATSWLSQRGFHVETASKWTEAILRFQETPPDIVLLDLSLPTVGGEAILEFIRELDSDLPVVVLSAGTDPDEIERIGALGASGFIRKPFAADDLVIVVEQTLAESGAALEEDEQTTETAGEEEDRVETRLPGPATPAPGPTAAQPELAPISPGAGVGALGPQARKKPTYTPERRRRMKKMRSRRTKRIRNYVLACVLFVLIAATIWIAQERLSGGFFGIGVTKSDM